MFVTVPTGKRLEISVLPISDICPHEAILPSLLRTIRNDMKRTGYQSDPILVDKKTKLALDGMHRIKSLEMLKARFIVCAEYDYQDSAIRLERWLRTIIGARNSLISTLISSFEMSPCKNVNGAIRRVDTNKRGIALLYGTKSFYGGEGLDLLDLYRRIGEIDSASEKSKMELRFVSDLRRRDVQTSRSVLTLYPAKITKKDLLKSVRKGELLPYKSTRFIVPLRPMGIHFPIEPLQRNCLYDCENILYKIVKLSKVELKQENIRYEGRNYSERLAVFKQS